MCGAFYCTGYMDELHEMYDVGEEIIVYYNQHDLLEKIRYYTNHLSEAERIRQAGHKRALSDHTYHLRFRKLFKEIGLT